MALSYGFFNSLNGDRKYDAEDFGRMFDGIITDGVIGSVGDAFAVKAAGGNKITVGSGRAWFNHTWAYNDASWTSTFDEANALMDRYDAIGINYDSINRRISWIQYPGKASSDPKKPTLSPYTLPLAYIYRKAGSTEITQADIENVVGTDECPLCTGVLKSMSTSQMTAQWDAEFNQWFSDTKSALTDDVAGNLLTKINNLDAKQPHVYYATFPADGWFSYVSESDIEKGYLYFRRTGLTCKEDNAPALTGNSVFMSGVGFEPTGVVETDDKLAEALEIINQGQATLVNNGAIYVKVREEPTVDITVCWTIRP